jgi:hypothetical protein
MAIAALFALALFAQDAPTPAPTAPVEGAVPPGAPEDDYGLVAWCHGALTGHMELYKAVKPELDKLSDDPQRDELDRQQMEAGREYLALYAGALNAAEKASAAALRPRGEEARAKGAGIWSPAANATDPKTRMWSWLMWDLPGRCETAAKRLAANAELAAPAVLGGETPPPTSTAETEVAPTDPAAMEAAALLGAGPADGEPSTAPQTVGRW